MEKLNLKKESISTHKIRKVLPYYAQSKGKLVLLLTLLITTGVLGIFAPIYSANALASLASGKFEQTRKCIIIVISLKLVHIILNYFIELLYVRIDSTTRVAITKEVVNSINQTKMKKLDSIKLGVLSERLSNDINRVSDSYLDMMNIVFNIITNFVFFCYIAYLNIYLFFILLGYVILLYSICTIRSRIWIRGRKLTKKANEEAKSLYIQQISGIRDVKLLNMKKNITDFANKRFEDAVNLEVSVKDKRNLIRRIQSVTSNSFEAIFMLLGIVFINKNLILLAGFLVIYNYYGKVENLINSLSSFNEFRADGEVAAVRIFEIIEDYEKEIYGNETLDDFSGKIEFKNLTYSYNNKNNILKDISLTFEPNKMTAIVGKSGSGKTTILNLISKLYDSADGQIFLDDKDINTLTEDSIKSNIGEISQAPFIFNTTIKQNLLFAKPDATDDELIKVLKEAQIYEDILKMENGIDTEIGENGVKISGGQKQRLAIARLLLKNNKVLVFDEATSALDNNSQQKIVDLLDSFKYNKTIIIVAHRLSTIIGADKIYMLDDGKVLSSGTHKELMLTCEKYKNLYELEENSSSVDKIKNSN